MPYWTLTFMIICLHGYSAGVTLPECVGPIKAIEIVRDGMNQAVTCQNLNEQQNVVWLLIRGNITEEIFMCNSTHCSNNSNIFKCSGNSSLSYVELKYPSLPLNYDNLTLGCKGVPPSSAEDEANCSLDAVYVGTQSSCKTDFNTDDWTVRGECLISNASSFRQRYACLWTDRSTNIQENITEDQTFINITSLSGNTRFVNFTCGFKKPMPIRNGSLDYALITYPGGMKRQVTFEGNNSIVFPSQPTTSDCDVSNIPENVPFRCNCSTKNIGHPNGRLIWLKGRNNNFNTVISAGNYSIPFLQMEPQRFLRNESGTQIKCVVNWATNITGTDHTVTVNYGPDIVLIPENNTFYTDSAGTRNITLTCQAIGVQPETNLLYSWTGLCYGITTKTCTIRPRPPSGNEANINTTVNCRIINPYNNNVSRDSSVLNLKYPPSQGPVLSGYEKDEVIYAGDILNITCTITGGQPVVTSTILKCLDQNKSTDGQISNLSFRLVSTNTSSIECICTGTWGFLPDLYTLNSTVQLNVFYAPSVPVITRNESQRFPYLEGDTVNLFCNIEESWGNPTSELWWVDHSEGQVGNKSHPATLQLNSVGVKDNNKSIMCQATNMYTTNKHVDIKNNTILQVYYRPIILLKKGEESDGCELTSDPWQCVVNAGHPVDVECFATSNPPPANISWTMENENHLSNYSRSRLTITSAVENGTFNCSVTTEKPNASDDRLPLSSTIELKIIVTNRTFHMENNAEIPNNVGAIIGGCIGAVVLISLGIFVALFLMKSRKGDKARNPQNQGTPFGIHKECVEVITPTAETKLCDNSSDISNLSTDVYSVVNKVNVSTINKSDVNEKSPLNNTALTSDSKQCKEHLKKTSKGKREKKGKAGKSDRKSLESGNTPLSMKPPREFVYENVTINTSSPDEIQEEVVSSQQSLDYATIQFSNKKQNEDKPILPKEEKTQYAFIDFSKTK